MLNISEKYSKYLKTMPVFIWAPTARCGITMLQRLITSSKQIFIYGENNLLSAHIISILAAFAKDTEYFDSCRERLAKGDYSFWTSSINPRMDIMQEFLVDAFYRLVAVYQRSATGDGFPRWGIKATLDNIEQPLYISLFLPLAKHVYIYRNLISILKSYKSRGWIKNQFHIHDVSALWMRNIEAIKALPENDRKLVIRYEDITADRDTAISRLKQYLGTSSIDSSVMDKKINTFEEHDKSGYVEPAGLTDQELQIASDTAGSMMKELGYEF